MELQEKKRIVIAALIKSELVRISEALDIDQVDIFYALREVYYEERKKYEQGLRDLFNDIESSSEKIKPCK